MRFFIKSNSFSLGVVFYLRAISNLNVWCYNAHIICEMMLIAFIVTFYIIIFLSKIESTLYWSLHSCFGFFGFFVVTFWNQNGKPKAKWDSKFFLALKFCKWGLCWVAWINTSAWIQHHGQISLGLRAGFQSVKIQVLLWARAVFCKHTTPGLIPKLMSLSLHSMKYSDYDYI